MRPLPFLTIAFLAAAQCPPAGAGEHRISVSLSGSLTTESKIFPNPNARDELIRGGFSPVDAVPGFGADVRGDLFPSGPRFGFSAEYVRRTISGSVPNSNPAIPVEDGFSAVPLELTAYFTIPVGGERFDFYMGGGAGLYFGERSYRYAGVAARTLSRSVSPGIHVLTGLEYLVGGRFALRTELKFRNVQLETVQEFPVTTTVYNGTTVPLPQDDFTSRIQIDGMNVSLGVAYRFW